ncbi:MAG: neutral/alkaline ceramidase [bacterium]|nr:neutral/alkaline ceramidase [bacterium]
MELNIGVGKFDVTGPCVNLGFMGMSSVCQTGKGIHTRLFSRAFVVEDFTAGLSVAFVCADLGACSMAIKQGVVNLLAKKGPFDSHGKPLYSDKNLMISVTHTHSAPGGYSHFLTYNASILGFNKQNFDVIVKGIYKSISRAHTSKGRGKILISSGDLNNCGKIRSRDAYYQNPEIDESSIADKDNVEPAYNKMTLLKFVKNSGETIGSFNWFALHPTNLGEKNKLVSGDNKGVAEQLLEKSTGVISAFANSCCGDISPNAGKDDEGNLYGCPDGKHDFERTAVFGKKQFEKARVLYDNAAVELTGGVDYRHTYVDMSDCIIAGSEKTWPAALGYGMVNGSQEDSTGMNSDTWGEGTTKYNIKGNPDFFEKLTRFALRVFKVKWPKSFPPGYEEGQGAKAVFLPAGFMSYKKAPIIPSVLPLQLFRLGSLLLVAHPGELTTVAGLRLRKLLGQIPGNGQGFNDIVVSTYSNGFASYTTTEDEYTKQEYEGASNLYGPFSLRAYLREYKKLAEALISNSAMGDGAGPVHIPSRRLKKVSAKHVRPDFKAQGLDFGEFDEPPESSYVVGDTVSVSFVAGYPNNNLKTGGSYFKIRKKLPNGFWQTMFTDDDIETRMFWMMRGKASMIRIMWQIPGDVEPGTYQILYAGPGKFKLGEREKSLEVPSPEFLVKKEL